MNNLLNSKGDFNDFVKEYDVFNYQDRDTANADIKSCSLPLEEKLRRIGLPKYFGEGDYYMHLPTAEAPVLDIDNAGVQWLIENYSYFTPHWSHGRNGKAHLVQHVLNPQEPNEVKYLKVNGENFAEIRFSGQTFASGKYNETEKSPEGYAWIERRSNGNAMEFSDLWKNMHEVVIVSALASAYEGNLFNFRTSVVGEMRNHDITQEDCLRMFERFNDLSIHQHPEWNNQHLQKKIYQETEKDIRKLYAKDLHSKLENIELGDLTNDNFVKSLRKLLKEYYEPYKYEEPQQDKQKKKISMWEEITAQELYATEFPEEQHLVEGIIGNGFVCIAGSPKVGKSFFTLGLARAISTGEKFLGRKTLRGHVKVLALEDHARRLKRRAQLMGVPNDGTVSFIRKSENLMSGLEEQIQMAYDNDPKIKAVIIDTYQRTVDKNKIKHKGNVYEMDTELLTGIQTLAQDLGIAIIVIHHTRKVEYVEGMDPFDLLSGSRGLQAMADGVLVFIKNRGEKEDPVKVWGMHRDIEENTQFEMKMVEYEWKYLGEMEKGKGTLQEELIHKYAKIFIDRQGFFRPKELIQEIMNNEPTVENTKKNWASYQKKLPSMKKKLIFVTGDRDGDYRYPKRLGEQDGEIILSPEDRDALIEKSNKTKIEHTRKIYELETGKPIF
jgi:hypothetical protein